MSQELEIATRYFINELKPDTLKLQKLLYFTQGISFCMNDEEFFEEQCEAWVHGPVVPSVYRKYNPIDTSYDINGMSSEQKEVLEYVKDTYGKYDDRYLEKLTHSQDPWLYARAGLDKDIPKEIIAEYFIGLMFQPSLEEWEI